MGDAGRGTLRLLPGLRALGWRLGSRNARGPLVDRRSRARLRGALATAAAQRIGQPGVGTHKRLTDGLGRHGRRTTITHRALRVVECSAHRLLEVALRGVVGFTHEIAFPTTRRTPGAAQPPRRRCRLSPADRRDYR